MSAPIGHNNPPVSTFVETIANNAPEAARDLLRGGVRLRVIATALLNRCLSEGATLEGEKVNLYRLAGIADGRRKLGDKPVKMTVDGNAFAVTASLHPAEVAKVKQAFSAMFSDVAFFVGEYTASGVKADVTAIKSDLLAGVTAVSTAKRAIAKARAAAEAAADKVEAEAAAGALQETGELLPPETIRAGYSLADIIAAMTEVGHALDGLTDDARNDFDALADAVEALNAAYNRAAERHDAAVIAADVNDEPPMAING